MFSTAALTHAAIVAVAKPASRAGIDPLVNAHLSTHKALNDHRHAAVVLVVTQLFVLATMVDQDVRLILQPQQPQQKPKRKTP